MKKICLAFIICLMLVGCGTYSSKSLAKDFENKVNNLTSYKLSGVLEIKNSDDIYKYDVDVAYAKKDKFRVSLKNVTNNHEQIILKNADGVYVLTPSLNKSFKFQSDWPYNNSQSYLLQTLLTDMQNDSNKKLKKSKNYYIVETKVNYPNNADLVKQKIYFDKKLNPKKVEVLDKSGNVLIKMTFKQIKINSKFKKNYFELEENMRVSKNEEQTQTVSQIPEDIYPLYIPENTKLTNKEDVNIDGGHRVIMTFEGDNPFMLVEQPATTEKDLEIVSVYGEPYQLATSVAALSDNMITWVANGIEYYVVSENMSENQLIAVASSVATLPVSK